MAELSAFNENEREFLQLTSQVRSARAPLPVCVSHPSFSSSQLPTRINALVQYESNPSNAQSELRRIKADLSAAKQYLADMEMANRSIPEPTRRELGNKIRMYKDSVGSLTKDLGQADGKFSRNSLMEGASKPLDFDKSQSSRDRMQQTTDKLRGGSDQLNSANRSIEETINVGSGIMEELGRNRETLNRVRTNVGEVGGTMDTARRILRGMSSWLPAALQSEPKS